MKKTIHGSVLSVAFFTLLFPLSALATSYEYDFVAKALYAFDDVLSEIQSSVVMDAGEIQIKLDQEIEKIKNDTELSDEQKLEFIKDIPTVTQVLKDNKKASALLKEMKSLAKSYLETIVKGPSVDTPIFGKIKLASAGKKLVKVRETLLQLAQPNEMAPMIGVKEYEGMLVDTFDELVDAHNKYNNGKTKPVKRTDLQICYE